MANATPEVMGRDTEPQAAGALALVGMGHELVRIENENMQKVAIQRPRDEGKVLAEALKSLELVPELASLAYYSLPYKDRSGEEEETKFVEGPSINAALELARRWGNCTTGARVLEEDEEGANLEGYFLDMETNFRITRPFRVSKFLKKRNGQVVRLLPDRWVMAQQSGASKAIRNAVTAGLPKAFVIAYVNKAKELVGGEQEEPADAKVVRAAVRKFEGIKITRDMLEHKLNKPVQEWLGGDVATLRGLWTAIEDKQTTVEEAFGIVTDDPKTGEAKPAGPKSKAQTKAEAQPATDLEHDPRQTAFGFGGDKTAPSTPPPPPPPPQAPPAASGGKRIPQQELWQLLCEKFGGPASATAKVKELTGGKKSGVVAMKDEEADELIKKVRAM